MVKYKVIQDPAVDDNEVLTLVNTEDNTEKIMAAPDEFTLNEIVGEDEIDIDDEEIESDIEVKTSVPGESAEVDAVLGLLTKAQEEAEKLGDEKLLDQIGNTITFFTRKHIVRSGE